MKKKFEASIQKAKSQAQLFFENSYKEISSDGSTLACGFPEMRDRTRLTEWGATSAAISGLKIIGINSGRLKLIFDKSRHWLISKQNEDGSWEASGLRLAEATAGVLLDLVSINSVDSCQIDKALSFLDMCYKNGYYLSTPKSIETPHIYTTYIVTKCLAKMSRLRDTNTIKSWLLSARTIRNRWGQTPGSNEDTPVHTIFALFTLNACGISWKEINVEFQKEINWIKKIYKEREYVYEEMQFEYDNSDEYGKKYGRLRLRHFTLPAVGNFFIQIDKVQDALIVARDILSQQFSGGWGPSKDELTMWATQQALELVEGVRINILPDINNFQYLSARLRKIPFSLLKLIVTIFGIGFIVLFLRIPEYRVNFVVGIFLMIFPWLVKRY